jgi:RNA polymerase sigma-70 factor (ECF subfamily)
MPLKTELGRLTGQATDEPCAEGGRHEDLVRAARGERAAIFALYREHHVHLRSFARRLLGDESLAEDLVHEVFANLPGALAHFRGQCSLRSYLIAVAANRASRQIRAATRRRAFETRLSREPAGAPRTPESEAEREELARLLSGALDKLPVEQRVAFVLCEVEERTSTEVGAMLGEKDTTIRARVFHAKKKLREELAVALAPAAVSAAEASPRSASPQNKRGRP